MMPFQYMCPLGGRAQSDPAEVVMEQLQLRGFVQVVRLGAKNWDRGDFGATNISQQSNLAIRFYCCDRYWYKFFSVCRFMCCLPSGRQLTFYCCVFVVVVQRWRQPSVVVGCSQLMCSYSYCLPVVEKVFRSFNGKLYLQDYTGENTPKVKVFKGKKQIALLLLHTYYIHYFTCCNHCYYK